MLKYAANDRKAFGKSLVSFGQIQRYIAENFARIEAAKTLTYAVARNVAPGTQNRVGTDAAKLFAAPAGKKAADDAELLRHALDALEHHREQTRPIARNDSVIERLRVRLEA